MTDVVRRPIEEERIPDKPLGRHVEHDERSRGFAYAVTLAPAAYREVHHRVFGGVLNQGSLGSCTGNATAGAVNTSGLHIKGTAALKEAEAVEIYKLATVLDGFPGAYPPQDTGSSGLAAAKAAQQRGHIKSYQHAFDLTAALTALQYGPVITGVDWYEGFDHPGDYGRVKIEGQVRGGHEIVAVGFMPAVDISKAWVILQNSWGADWGYRGRFRWQVATWQKLLDDQGDATILLNSV